MLKRFVISLLRKAIFAGIAVGVLLLIGHFTEDKTDYPGKKEFEEVNSLINTSSGDVAYGDSEGTKVAASKFASSMKTMQSALFSGGSGRSFATGGNFLTYVKRTPEAVVILCHVPELRNYKDEAREAIAQLAWTTGQAVTSTIPGIKPTDTLIIGLRGFASYGPIWEGTVSGEAAKKTNDLDEKKRLYPFFVQTRAES